MPNTQREKEDHKVKIKIEPDTEEKTEKDIPISEENDIMMAIYDTNDTIHTDQTGKFPTVSSRGNKYQMVLTHIDTNSIWVEPTKNKTEGEMILARR